MGARPPGAHRPRDPTFVIRGDVRSFAGWLLLAACAGLTLGVAARVAMRLVALQADVSPGFSFGGSVEVVLYGALVGTPVALLYWVCRQRVRLPAWAGVTIGLVLFAFLATWQPPSARSALRDTPDAPVATSLLFAGVFVVYGVALEMLWRLKRPR